MPPSGPAFDTCPAPRPMPLPEWRRLNLRRLALIVPSLTLAFALLSCAVAVLAATPHGWLDWALLLPFGLAMSWECLIVWQLILGFGQWLKGPRGRSPIEVLAETLAPVSSGRTRTAILIPIFDEDPRAVMTAVSIMMRSLTRLGPCDDIEIHVLSDSRNAALVEVERQTVAAVIDSAIALHYRHRPDNAGRKAGNIGEFLDRRGIDFDFAIVLDADSLMSGTSIRRLIRVMEESPRVGLLQTVSYAVGRTTLFARIQQFAVRLYAPLALRGLHYWQGPEGSYWGHNAIFRVAPFHTHCRLPVLPGRPPLGGEILCHDVVEGAMLARAGWEVHLLPEFDGTWEEMPTNTLDLAGRERRWCQGNLQHMRVLAWPGLKAASRAHLALGLGGYLVVPLWWIMILLGALRVLWLPDGRYGLLAYGATEDGLAAALLLAGSAALILLPRLLNLVCAVSDRAARRSFGGFWPLLAGTLIEQVFALLLGPVLSLITAGFVMATLLGRGIGWRRQERADRQVSIAEALRCHAPHIACGVALGAAALAGGGLYSVWLAPTALGLCLSPVLTALSSRQDLGRLSQRAGLFLTHDDVHTAPELRELYGVDERSTAASASISTK